MNLSIFLRLGTTALLFLLQIKELTEDLEISWFWSEDSSSPSTTSINILDLKHAVWILLQHIWEQHEHTDDSTTHLTQGNSSSAEENSKHILFSDSKDLRASHLQVANRCFSLLITYRLPA